MKKSFLLLALLSLLTGPLYAQNLVTNGGFETYNYIPTNYTQWDACAGWTNAGGTGTPDYFSTLSSGGVHLPNTSAGTFLYPHSGDADMGFLTWSGSISNDYREYITTQFNQPMTPGLQYDITFYLSNGQHPYYGYGSNNIGLYFSDAAPAQSGSGVISVIPQLEITSIFYDTAWMQFHFTYTPTAANQYLTIGNFRDDASTLTQQYYIAGQGRAYYFIDDITVLLSPQVPVANFTPNNISECAGNCIQYTNLSVDATSYNWLFPGGNPSMSSDTNPLVCYANAGKYNVQLIATNSFGSDTSLFVNNVTINTSPAADSLTLSRDSICEGTGVTSKLSLTDTSNHIQWQSSIDGIHFSTISGDTLNTYTTPRALTQTTYYRIMATNGCGSDSSNVVVVHILPAPSVRFNYSTNGKQVSFQADSASSNVTSYAWDFGDGQTSKELNPVHTFDSVKTYYICLTVFNGSNCSYSYCRYVSTLNTGVETVSSNPSIQLYPNPANNTLNLSISGLPANYQLKIYNVLGQLIGGIHESPLNGNENIPIDLSGIAPGTYELILMNDKQYYSSRFVHLK